MCKFVLMGGGDIGLHNTSYKTAVFDEEIIKLTEKSCPNFLFIGLAGNSDTTEHWYSVLKGIYGDTYGCRTDYLTFSDIKDQIVTKAKIENADIIYVGGGITQNLMRRIRMYGIDAMLAGLRSRTRCSAVQAPALYVGADTVRRDSKTAREECALSDF